MHVLLGRVPRLSIPTFIHTSSLFFTSVSSLLVFYFSVIFLIHFIQFLKISFFLAMSLLSSLLYCFVFSLSMSLYTFRISFEKFLVHLMCCHTSFWMVGLRCGNPSPRVTFRVAALILSCGCGGSASGGLPSEGRSVVVNHFSFRSYVPSSIPLVCIPFRLCPVAILLLWPVCLVPSG